LREVAPLRDVEEGDRDQACFPVHRDDSSRNVTAMSAEPTASRDVGWDGAENRARPPDFKCEPAPTTIDDALRLAIRLAVDAGEYDRAVTLIDLARRTANKLASVTALAVERERRGEK
jgi:hypothetical protein